MNKYIDITGKRFFDIEVLAYHGSNGGRASWLCLCHKCGKECVKSRKFLLSRSKENSDCGCTYKAIQKEKCRDLSGETFGAIKVLHLAENTGDTYKRSRLYLCKCMICGNEHLLPVSEIKSNMASCGCLRYQPDEMKRRSALGVATNVKDGVHVSLLKKKEANKNSQTGVRGVYPGKNGTFECSVQVAGKTRRKKGFLSIDSAKKARDCLKAEMIEEFGMNPDDFN